MAVRAIETLGMPHAPAAEHEVRPYRLLLRLLRQESNGLWVAIVYSLAVGVLTLAVPIATQSLVNTIAFGNLLQPLLVLSAVVLCVLLISAVLQLLRYQVVEMLQRRVFVRMASESIERLLAARADVLRLKHGPEIVNRFLEVVSLQKAGATLLVDGLSVGTQTIMGMALLALYHPWLVAFDAILMAALLIVLFPLGANAVTTAIQESKAKYALVAWLQEVARHTTAFRGTEQAHWALERTDSCTSEYLKYRASHFRVVMRQFAGSLAVQALASAFLLGGGGLLVINRQLTLGQLVAAELVVAAVVSGFSKIAKHLESYYDLLASLDKLSAVTGLETETGGTEAPPSASGPAELVLRHASTELHIPAGERVALTGTSGSGKSTLIDVICGYRPHTAWSVEMDGVDIRHLRLSALRSSIGMVRTVEIFQGTVLENVRVGRTSISAAQVQQVLTRLGIWGDIQKLPDGLNTVIATGGAPLSEGVAVVLMIARAIAGGPRLLILDETLDQVLDARERDLLTEKLFAPDEPWTLLIATSRQDLLDRCSKVIALPEGA